MMKSEIAARLGRLMVLFLFIGSFAGCGLDSADSRGGFRIVLDETQELNHVFRLLSSPTSTSEFGCFAANVTGSGIEPKTNLGQTCTSTNDVGGRGWGVFSSPTSRGAAIELDILPGQRTIDVYGVYPSTAQCGGNATGVSAYWLGRATENITNNATVRVPISFTSGTSATVTCAGGGSSGVTLPTIKFLDSSWITMTSLSAYFKMDDSPVSHLTSVVDSSGTGLTASLTTNNGITDKSITAKVSNGFNLDGTDDYISVTDPGVGSALDVAAATSITLMAWIKPTSLPLVGEILCKGTNNYGMETGDGVGGNQQKLTFYYFDGAAWQNYRTTANVLASGIWHHVAFTYTFGTPGSAVFYVNGASVAGSWTSGAGTTAPQQNNLALTVGFCAASTPFPGVLDDVSIWKRALSGAEISTVYTRQL